MRTEAERRAGDEKAARKGVLNKKVTRKEGRGRETRGGRREPAEGTGTAGKATRMRGRRRVVRAERPGRTEKESAGARIKSIAVRGTTSFARPPPSPRGISAHGVASLAPFVPRAYQPAKPRRSAPSRSHGERIGARVFRPVPPSPPAARRSSLLSASTIVFCFIITAARGCGRAALRSRSTLSFCRRSGRGAKGDIAINRRWPVVTVTFARTSIVAANAVVAAVSPLAPLLHSAAASCCSAVALRKICLSVDRSVV